MSGNFSGIASQALSAGVAEFTTAEFRPPVTAPLKHFLYTFSRSRAPPVFCGAQSTSRPPERLEWAWAAQPSLQLQIDEEARPTRLNCLHHTQRGLPVLN